MIKTTVLLFYILTSASALGSDLQSETDTQHINSYEAIYEVIRNGKVMAEQKTKLKKISPNHYVLNDVTKGTHGLASFTGFKRSESSSFKSQDNDWTVEKHEMQQKVTFSKRNYSFEQNAQTNQIEGLHKKEPFTLNNLKTQPIASHMLPLRISQLACTEQKPEFEVTVLKSKHTSLYHFTATTEDNGLIKVSRHYPNNKAKSSYIWLNPRQQCVSVKSLHTDENDVIETKITTFNSKAVAH